jgi:hypothetical protein
VRTLIAGAFAMRRNERSRHRSFGYDKAELRNFAVDSRRSPHRVLDRHALNEIPHFPVGSVAEESANGSEEGENAMSHEMTVVTERQVGDGLARRQDLNH